ncbi:putative lipid II flippase FtsW [Gulosibacter molinativorax]|uniref:Probable peptidoglycan glycosyltransferase FtsW n=1 Tax=Gulosibacter molinativorax TaxID=256821 RepID=A0ABT7C5C5_9MICO|nr:putative lipid II flippase FtsW [Gulosibacter molinativorax]MDJ1370397.1 putative lipid II flippase FtsW [Gulosibacter molinativorax]QUY61310.1 Cell division protein FtsW [Gulosibacter molinativorax]
MQTSPTKPATRQSRTGTSGHAFRIRLPKSESPASLNATLLLAVVALLVGFGLIMVLSSSAVEEYAAGRSFSTKFLKQLLFAVLGVPVMFAISRIPLRYLTGNLAWVALGGVIVLQLLVFTPLGLEINGNRAWLNFGVTTVQPAEFAKLALCMWLAMMVTRLEPRLEDWRKFIVPLGVPVVIVLGLALGGKDLGTVIVLGALVLGALWFGGIKARYLAVAAIAAVAGAILMAIISPNRVARITSFFSGDCDYEGLCWQTSHGFFALARGGVFGVGLGNSTAKWSWLPEADNDYIFAIIGEEFGLVGATAVILMFGALGVILLRIWRQTESRAGRVIVGGVFTWFTFQAFVNIAVVIGLLPVLGVPLPFLSSGGSALVTTLAAVGLVLSVARENTAREAAAASSPKSNAKPLVKPEPEPLAKSNAGASTKSKARPKAGARTHPKTRK